MTHEHEFAKECDGSYQCVVCGEKPRSNSPRVLVKSFGRRGVNLLRWECTAHASASDDTRGVWDCPTQSYFEAHEHARTCPDLNLALLRKWVAGAAEILGEWANVSAGRARRSGSDFEAGAGIAYGAARLLLLEETGIYE